MDRENPDLNQDAGLKDPHLSQNTARQQFAPETFQNCSQHPCGPVRKNRPTTGCHAFGLHLAFENRSLTWRLQPCHHSPVGLNRADSRSWGAPSVGLTQILKPMGIFPTAPKESSVPSPLTPNRIPSSRQHNLPSAGVGRSDAGENSSTVGE